MKIEVKNIGSCKKELAIEVEALKHARVPGFRPGKAPMSFIKQRYKEAIREDFLEAAVQKHFLAAVKAEDFSPLQSPQIHDLSYAEGQPLRFKAVFEILPKLEVSSYKGLEIERILPEVKDEEIETSLKQLQERIAQFVPVEDRGVQSGDFAVITYSGKFTDGTQPGLNSKDVYCEVGGASTLREFSENLVGAKIGEIKTFCIKYSQDFPNQKLAGKEVEYTLELQAIKLKKIPELNDDFAKDVGEFATLEELASKIRADLTTEKERAVRSEMQSKLLDQVIENNPFEVPEVMVHKQAENRLNDYVRTLLMQGIHPQTLDMNWAEFQERQREQAVHDVKAALVLEHIADQENITVTDEEVEEEISKRAQEAQQSFEALKSRLTKDGGTDRIRNRIRNRKSLDLLLSFATFKSPQAVIVQP
ncbi:MAG: trigger factor [Acidobacteria bacterium]|nr:MAG: trigger factor [Acidobacteriota bacterium]